MHYKELVVRRMIHLFIFSCVLVAAITQVWVMTTPTIALFTLTTIVFPTILIFILDRIDNSTNTDCDFLAIVCILLMAITVVFMSSFIVNDMVNSGKLDTQLQALASTFFLFVGISVLALILSVLVVGLVESVGNFVKYRKTHVS